MDNVVVWEGDAGGATGIQDLTLNLQNQLKWKTTAAIKVCLYDAKGVSNYGLTASWNLPAGNWAISEAGTFAGTSAYYPATPGLNIPLVTMIYDGGYGSGTNRWTPTTNYVAQANIIAQAAALAGHTIGIIQYCLDKSTASQQFPIVRDLYGLWTAKPLIATHPQNQTATAGRSAIFSVTAAGGEPLSYQWRFNGNVLPGAGSSSYSLLSVQNSNAGSYSVLVTNSFGAALSSNALLTVVAPPVPLRFSAINLLPDNRIRLVLASKPGAYVIEISTNLASWSPLTNVVNSYSSVAIFDLDASNAPTRFYRAFPAPL